MTVSPPAYLRRHEVRWLLHGALLQPGLPEQGLEEPQGHMQGHQSQVQTGETRVADTDMVACLAPAGLEVCPRSELAGQHNCNFTSVRRTEEIFKAHSI